MTTIEGFPWTGDPEVQHLHAPIIPLLPLPTCDLCGLPITNGRGEPWPSCRCELNDQTCGESAEPSNP